MVEGKTVTTDHPVAYVSGLFRGSQLNWAALTKEAYAIYMSVKKLAFYLTCKRRNTGFSSFGMVVRGFAHWDLC